MSWKMEGHDRGGNKGKKIWNQRLLKIYMKTYYCRSFQNVYIHEKNFKWSHYTMRETMPLP